MNTPLTLAAVSACRRSTALAAVVALASVLSTVIAGAQPIAPGDHYLCYRGKGLRGYPQLAPRTGDAFVDAFDSATPTEPHTVDLKKVLALCNPADKNGEGVADDTTHLEAYSATLTRMSPSQTLPFSGTYWRVSNQLGQLVLRVRKMDRVLVPTAKAIGTNGAPPLGANAVDHFKCYRAQVALSLPGQPTLPPFIRRTVTVEDQFGTRVIDLRKVTRLCNPADKNAEDPGAPTHPGHLVCYQARIARTDTAQDPFVKTAVSTNNQFGNEVLSLNKIDEFCVPSLSQQNVAPTPTRSATPTPTTTRTPTPTYTGPTPTPNGTPIALRILPSSRTVNVGGTGNFTAQREYANTSHENVTQQAVWSSSDQAIATVSNVDGERGRATGVAPGTATIRATDPGSGLSSTASGLDATMTVTGPLQRIELTPESATIDVGEVTRFIATGYYQGGATRNITQQVLYASSNVNIVSTPNETGDKSRVQGVGPGTATITASDPASGITTGSADDATVSVRGQLQYITLSPLSASRGVGEIVRYTATGHYQGNTTANITQQVTYSSSDESVAEAPNEVGDKSRVETVGFGTTIISATQPGTGITSAPIDSGHLEVLGALECITLTPASKTLVVGQSQSFTATGHYAGGGTKNLTQQADYASTAPNVAVATNTSGNKSRVDAVAAGTASISATDPQTGVGSANCNGNAAVTVVAP